MAAAFVKSGGAVSRSAGGIEEGWTKDKEFMKGQKRSENTKTKAFLYESTSAQLKATAETERKQGG